MAQMVRMAPIRQEGPHPILFVKWLDAGRIFFRSNSQVHLAVSPASTNHHGKAEILWG